MSTLGMDLMNKIHSGEIRESAPSKVVAAARSRISESLEEMLEIGARIRPLKLQGKQVGWVRGVHLAERKLISRWYADPSDRIFQILRIATTLGDDRISDLDTFEFRALVKLVTKLSDQDVTLFPFISAFTCTSMSETLWASQGAGLVVPGTRSVDMLDGRAIRILAPPDHARLWAALAAARERSKHKLDDMFNAALITKAMVGKGANKLFSDLQRTAKKLIPDIDDPWKEIVPGVEEDVDFEDGWGHAHQDTSEEGFWRESQGLIHGDKHEAFMDKFYQQQMDAAQEQEAEMERKFQENSEWGGVSDTMTVVTPAEMARRDREALLAAQALSQVDDMNGDENAEDILARQHLRARGFK